jgi:hypothetical protein
MSNKIKKDATIGCLQETYLTTNDTHKLKVNVWKKIQHKCRNQKQAGIAILISDKADIKQKSVRSDKISAYY